MAAPVPSLPGVLTVRQVAQTAASIAGVQDSSGAIAWFEGGQVDPWDHVECAMALLAAGECAAAERAYEWLFASQREDGTWPIRLRGGVVEDDGADSNMCAYVAVGAWHHWLVRRDRGFVRRAWPVVRRALDHVTRCQLGFGGIGWAQDASGRVADSALLTGSSSVLHALGCGIALAELVGSPQPEWELAADQLAHALRFHEDRFLPKAEFSMDWYYPVLAGALRGAAARARLGARWADFVVPGLGARCVEDRPWVTGAETCELVLALDAVGWSARAQTLLHDMQHLRQPDGAYWTGYVYPDQAHWPVETSTWTGAAVILAVDALSRTTPGSSIFRAARPPVGLVGAGGECGCAIPVLAEPAAPAAAERSPVSADGVTGLAADAGQGPHRAEGTVRDEVAAFDRA